MIARAATIYWLIDESGSMRMDNMSVALQGALQSGCESLARPRPEYASVEVYVRALFFGQTTRWASSARLPIKGARIGELLPFGVTNVAPALREITAELTSRPQSPNEMPPIIVLISDGLPTDAYRDSLEDFKEACRASGAVRIAVALGRLCARGFCREFLGESPFDCMAAETSTRVNDTVHRLCDAVIPAFLARLNGAESQIPLDPAAWMPKMLNGAVPAPRISSQAFHTCALQQIEDGLAGAALANVALRTPGDDIRELKLDALLHTQLLSDKNILDRNCVAKGSTAGRESVGEASDQLSDERLRRLRVSLIYAERDRVTVVAAQHLVVAVVTSEGAEVHHIVVVDESISPESLQSRKYSFDIARPSTVLIASQSMRDSFGSDEDFAAVASDLLGRALEQNGLIQARNALESWLKRASATGSCSVAAVAVVSLGNPPSIDHGLLQSHNA